MPDLINTQLIHAAARDGNVMCQPEADIYFPTGWHAVTAATLTDKPPACCITQVSRRHSITASGQQRPLPALRIFCTA